MSEPTLQDLASRIDYLESYAAIQQLIADYAHGFDREDPERLAGIWFDDSVFDVGEFGRYVGRDAIVEGAKGLWEAIPEQHHWQANQRIEIDGDTATGLTALDCAVTSRDAGPHMVGGYYKDTYERRNGEWKIAERLYIMEYWSPIRGPLREGTANELDGAATT
jgi:uncharacterized protein (TIGR02246 family)